MKHRNYGIDLMRIISMFYVIVLHVLGQGGVLNATQAGTHPYDVSWFLEIWAYCAVDIFGLISGYVGFHQNDRPVKYSNYISLWLEVAAYGLVVTFAYWLRHPELVTKADFLQMCLPVSNQLYWYFTAYTGLFLIMPVLNHGIQKMSERTLRKMLVVLIAAFSCYSTLRDVFSMGTGYTFIWLVILYLIGAIMKKCNIGKKIRPLKAFILIVLLMLFTWIWKLKGLTWQGTTFTITPDLFVSYVSPTVLLTAMLYLIGASKLNISDRLAKIIEFGGSSAFAAYLLNNQKSVWNYGMNQRFVYMAGLHSYVIPLHVFGFAAGFVIASILIDKVRMLVFRLLHIRQFSEWIDRKAHEFMNRIVVEGE